MPIFEKKSLKDIEEYLDSQTLLVLDLDNTLIESSTHYGSFQWGKFLIQKAVKEGVKLNDALDRIIPLWEKVQYQIDLKLIEKEAPALLQKFAEKGAINMALTGRSFQVEDMTIELLKNNKITFADWEMKKYVFDLPYEYSFKKGVFFAGPKNQKGAVISQLIDQLDWQVQRVVFVDDQMHIVEEVEKAMASKQVEYIGVRYSGADQTVLKFDYSISMKEQEKLLPLNP